MMERAWVDITTSVLDASKVVVPVLVTGTVSLIAIYSTIEGERAREIRNRRITALERAFEDAHEFGAIWFDLLACARVVSKMGRDPKTVAMLHEAQVKADQAKSIVPTIHRLELLGLEPCSHAIGKLLLTAREVVRLPPKAHEIEMEEFDRIANAHNERLGAVKKEIRRAYEQLGKR